MEGIVEELKFGSTEELKGWNGRLWKLTEYYIMDRGGFLFEYFPQIAQMNADYEITLSAQICGISGKLYLARITLKLNPRQQRYV
jgi:hypothetical protein